VCFESIFSLRCTTVQPQKTSTGAAGCGFGPPSLPYLYKTSELLQRQQHVCISISRGGGGFFLSF